MVKIVRGNLFNAREKYLAHQVNCKGVMGSGVAKTMKLVYPEVFDMYKAICNGVKKSEDLLGTNQHVQTRDGHIVVNIFAENNYGKDGGLYTKYEVLEMCFTSLANDEDVKKKGLAMPYKIGCGLGGGDWYGVVFPMMERVFTDCDLTLYRLELI